MLFQLMERAHGFLMPPPFWIRDRGRWGEYLVRRLYHRRGYHCLHRNWRYSHGEIDLIMGSPKQVMFLEVKTRRAQPNLRLDDTLGKEQEMRLLGLAEIYLRQWPEIQVPWSFRLAVVQFQSKGRYQIQEARLA